MQTFFSQEVKNEICSSRPRHTCCKKSILYGMIFGSEKFLPGHLMMRHDNQNVGIYFAKLQREVCPELNPDKPFSGDPVQKLYSTIGITDFEAIQPELISCQNCKWMFVRGVFLSCGTITQPSKAYHLEFTLKTKPLAESFAAYLEELGLQPRITERKEKFFGVYFKDSEVIADILGYLGANKAEFKMLDVKIYKDVRNAVNRDVNCETANMSKTAAASASHVAAIEKIVTSDTVESLSAELRTTLDLRVANPDASLAQLAAMHNPPLTRSGVNHRLKKLMELAESIENRQS